MYSSIKCNTPVRPSQSSGAAVVSPSPPPCGRGDEAEPVQTTLHWLIRGWRPVSAGCVAAVTRSLYIPRAPLPASTPVLPLATDASAPAAGVFVKGGETASFFFLIPAFGSNGHTLCKCFLR